MTKSDLILRDAIKTVKCENFLVDVSLMPILPYISDSEIVIGEMICKFKDINCDYVFEVL